MKRGFVLLIILLLFISGCVVPGQVSNQIISGKKGVTLEFLNYQPPDEIYGPFKVGVKLTNFGLVNNINNLNLNIYDALSGFGRNNNEIVEDTPSLTLQDAELINKQIYPVEENYISDDFFYSSSLKSGTETSIIAILSYNVRASIPVNICFAKSSFFAKNCPVDMNIPEAINLEAYSSPVSIVNVNRKYTPGSDIIPVVLVITLQNMGEGNVVADGNRKENEIDFSINTGSDKFTCSKVINEKIKLDKTGKTEIVCVANIQKDQDYIDSVIYINLAYSYKSFYSKKVKFYNIGGNNENMQPIYV